MEKIEEPVDQMSVLCIKEKTNSQEKDLNSSLVTFEDKTTLIDNFYNSRSSSNSNRHSSSFIKATRKAKRIRFYRNGDKFYNGVVVAVSNERYKSFDSLITDLTRALISNVTLPNGVRIIYTMDGKKVLDINDLEDGKSYVVSGQGEAFKKVDYSSRYSSSSVKRGGSLTGLPSSPATNARQVNSIPLYVKAKIITLIRNGPKPRRIARLLLNKRNSPSVEHVLEAITEVIKLDSGAVRKVYSLSGQQITLLEQFFEEDDIFMVYGMEKANHEDFELDFEESKCVQSFRKGQCSIKKHNGPMPKMPAKTCKRSSSNKQVRTPSPSTVNLPMPLKLQYSLGQVIGDGNFAVVRQCTHKYVISIYYFLCLLIISNQHKFYLIFLRTTGSNYAIKIIDKYKCQGKEAMLAREVAILRQVRHPNIISLIEEQETNDHLFLVMELMKVGTTIIFNV